VLARGPRPDGAAARRSKAERAIATWKDCVKTGMLARLSRPRRLSRGAALGGAARGGDDLGGVEYDYPGHGLEEARAKELLGFERIRPGLGDLHDDNSAAAIASEAKPLIGIYAESGKGKTYSALLLAKGFAGDMAKVGMIETESGRGEAYADDPVVGGYNVLPLRETSRPRVRPGDRARRERGLRVLIIDSASHEWEGVGGVLAMAAANQADGKKGVLVWQQPKILHQREFMGRLLQTPIPLVIVCMRAKYPMKEATAEDVERVKGDGKKPPKRATGSAATRSSRSSPTTSSTRCSCTAGSTTSTASAARSTRRRCARSSSTRSRSAIETGARSSTPSNP
jgi:hypothetical protein